MQHTLTNDELQEAIIATHEQRRKAVGAALSVLTQHLEGLLEVQRQRASGASLDTGEPPPVGRLTLSPEPGPTDNHVARFVLSRLRQVGKPHDVSDLKFFGGVYSDASLANAIGRLLVRGEVKVLTGPCGSRQFLEIAGNRE